VEGERRDDVADTLEGVSGERGRADEGDATGPSSSSAASDAKSEADQYGRVERSGKVECDAEVTVAAAVSKLLFRLEHEEKLFV